MQIDAERYSIWVVFSEESLDRMRQYDPAEVVLEKMPEVWCRLLLKDVVICYASADDEKHITKLCQSGAVRQALQYLSRGWKFRRDLGDNDNPYTSLMKP